MARKNWLLGLGAVAVIAVPLGIALKQDLGKEPPAAVPEAAAPPAPVAPPEPAKPAMTRHMPSAFFRDVIGTSKPKPSLVGPLFRVRWGVTRDELKQSAPELFSWHDPDVLIIPDFDDEGALAAVVIDFPDDGVARRTLHAAWGDRWVSADGDLQVTLDSSEPGKARVVVSPAAR